MAKMTKTSAAEALDILMIGWVLPSEIESEVARIDSLGANQTFAFYQGLAESLRRAQVRQEFVSFWPLQDFPGVKKLFVPGGRWTLPSGEPVRSVPFINLLGFKHLSRWLAGRPAVAAWARRRTGPCAVVVGGVHSACLWLGIKAARKAACPFIVVLTDPAGVPIPGEKGLRARVRWLDNRLIQQALSRADAVIGITGPLSRQEAPHAPAMVVEGFIRPELAEIYRQPASVEAEPQKIVYAGGLNADYGVEAMLKAFQFIDLPVELHLFGRGAMQTDIEAAAAADSRIRFHGYQNSSVVYEAIRTSTLYWNLRPLGHEVERLTFPSKLLEALALGAAVMTTPLAGIPQEYEGALEFVHDADPQAVARQTVALLEDGERRSRLRENARVLIRERCLPETRGRSVREFIEGAIKGRAERP